MFQSPRTIKTTMMTSATTTIVLDCSKASERYIKLVLLELSKKEQKIDALYEHLKKRAQLFHVFVILSQRC